jgi:hypothetical protein
MSLLVTTGALVNNQRAIFRTVGQKCVEAKQAPWPTSSPILIGFSVIVCSWAVAEFESINCKRVNKIDSSAPNLQCNLL